MAGAMTDSGAVLADTQAGDGAGRSSSAGRAASFSGWDSPRPIGLDIPTDALDGLRAQVARDIEFLRPRCEALHRSLAPEARDHRGYRLSRQRREDFPILSSTPPHRAPRVPCIAPPMPSVIGMGADAALQPIETLLREGAPVLGVGAVFGPRLRATLERRLAVIVASNEGEPDRVRSGGERPAATSLSGWLARHDEAERTALAGYLLGRDTILADIDLLRGRLHPHQRLVIEPGAAALAWLLTLWDGSVTRDGDLFVFSEPGPAFREPSRRMGLARGLGWPRISVVTVSFNQRDYLEQCLRSVLDQDYPALEYIVVDAGSTDGSIEVLESYAPRLSRLIVEPDDGQSDGINKGFRHATGEILTWVNSDDMLAPLALRRAALAFAEHGVDLVAGTCSRISGSGDLLYRHHSVLRTGRAARLPLSGVLGWRDSWEQGDYFFQPEVFFSRDMWLRAGGYLKPYLYWAMDWDLWLRCAAAGATAVRIPDVLGISREHPQQKTTTDELYLWQILHLLEEYGQLIAALEGMRR